MGEEPQDRVELLHTLATLPEHPQSVPINQLVRVKGTPLADSAPLDPFDFVRMIAAARILMPASHVRLSAGRAQMSDELQALCFMAGANSIFYGEKLLTTGNPDTDHDQRLFQRLKIVAESPTHTAESPTHTTESISPALGPAPGPASQSFPHLAGASVAR
jgi:biotin synthase